MEKKVTGRSIYIVSALIVFSFIAASVLLELLDVWLLLRVLIGLVPVGLLVFQIVLCFRYARAQDEVQKRIILEGLAIAFAIAVPLVFLLGFLMKAGVAMPFEFIDSGVFLEVALLIGYAIAYKRYQ